MNPERIKAQALFLIDRELKQRLKLKAAQEQRDMSEIVEELVKEYLKIHGEGNPAYAITKWLDEADFKATPAFFEQWQKWKEYLKKCNRKELTAIESRAIILQKECKEWFYENRDLK